MAQSWPASCQAAAVSVGGLFAVLIIAVVTHRSSPWVMGTALAIPVLLFGAIAAYEWRLGRRFGITLSRLHLIGVVAGLTLWLMYQTAPGSLPFDPTATQLCAYVGHPGEHACLVKADAARMRSDITWWSTGTLIVLFGLFTRRSRTAAWTTPAIAIAGGALALYFLEVFVTAQGGFVY
ncbi:hypothetical protein [Actinoallomurus sp. NPDC050550]|uniref:hypothetical protein n=1 Tax=Actinoallomurus sp. NPDC050550 TaxID=3154937 RepID=UPI0033C3FC0B